MLTKSTETYIGRWIAYGTAFVTLLVTSTINVDPVNVSKLIASSGVGIGLLAVAHVQGRKILFRDSFWPVLVIMFFILWATVSVFFSDAPATQNIFGVNGRNTGLIAYVALAGVAIGALLLRRLPSFEILIYALLFAWACNVVYGLFVLSGNDFIGWNNVYNTILGTFGNPNFVSAFLGMGLVAGLAYSLDAARSWTFRVGYLVLALTAFYEIVSSKAIQGIAVSVFGVTVVGFYFVRAHTKGKVFSILYAFGATTVGSFAVAGGLQIGPLTDYVYKRSVSLRGHYWHAGLEMAKEHPIFGVGIDAYGDWFRRSRSTTSMIDPGPGTVTNSAHNVPIDILSGGGFPIFIAYMAILLFVLIAIVKVTMRQRKFDGIFVTLVSTWFCYQVQSIISINQIGLAIWGWVLSGAVIAYEIATRTASAGENPTTNKQKIKSSPNDVAASTFLVSVVGCAMGLAIAAPPFLADAGWRSALRVGEINGAVTAATKFQLDSTRMAQAVATFEDSKAFTQAHDLALKAVAYNPDFYDGWRLLGFISTSTPEEKAKAEANLKRLDPLNPQWNTTVKALVDKALAERAKANP